MRFRNKRNGVIVEPASETAATSFIRSPDYEPVPDIPEPATPTAKKKRGVKNGELHNRDGG
jgi:hypothetical protein